MRVSHTQRRPFGDSVSWNALCVSQWTTDRMKSMPDSYRRRRHNSRSRLCEMSTIRRPAPQINGAIQQIGHGDCCLCPSVVFIVHKPPLPPLHVAAWGSDRCPCEAPYKTCKACRLSDSILCRDYLADLNCTVCIALHWTWPTNISYTRK